MLVAFAKSLHAFFIEGQMMEIKCGTDGCLHNVEGLEACAPIPVSLDDTDFAVYNRCLKFVRNLEVPNIQCVLGK